MTFVEAGGLYPYAARNATVRERLRHATATIHQTLHEHPGFVRLIAGRTTPLDYRALLARLYGFHWPFDQGLRVAPPEILAGLKVRDRERSPDLRADLRHLGMPVTEIDSLPVCDYLRPVCSNAELLGRLYVVEGAGLGGRILARKLDGLLGEREKAGRQFFAGRAPPDPLPWPTLCGWLESLGGPTDIGVVLESAETTFNAMARWLAEGVVDV